MVATRIWRLLVNATHARSADRQYLRHVMNGVIGAKLDSLNAQELSAVEISGDQRGEVGWASYSRLIYPDFDQTEPPRDLPGPFDVVICEQVLEHVVDPWKAVRTLYALTRPGGTVIVDTPFLIRMHTEPGDYWRFSPEALRLLLGQAGFEVEEVGTWGNRVAVMTNLFGWTPVHRGLPMRAHPDFPVVVWAFAKRPARSREQAMNVR
jgi:SAM-dependent methyltransferase